LDFDPKLLAMGGGAPVQEVVSSRWKALTGRHIREGYGLSETSPILTCTPFAEERFLGSIGEVVPGTELAIRDENGADIPRGEVGELCARGPQVMQGYWRQPAATLQFMTSDGYFRTGDLARQDENGRYYIVDRQKDMILVSGFNVYPNEVEATVSQLADVVECACVGVPDQTTGEAVVLFVVGRTQNFDVQRIRVHCRENMAAYKVPRHIHMIEEMPKSSVGKILRRELRERLIHGKVMEES
jgi:long-chain acyl-CoA synthetase